jgi:DNA-binding response OmpR family regulator
MYNHIKFRSSNYDLKRNQVVPDLNSKGLQSMAKIMIVDDEPVIIESLSYSLRREGYEVFNSSNGKEAMELFVQCQPDLVVLDIRLPEMDGLEVCKRLRISSTVPIIMLTARTDELDRILGLEVGADDYLPKPFSFRELLARIRALLRRVAMDQKMNPGTPLQIGGLSIDPVSRRVLKNHQELQVSAREFEILNLMMSKAGQACSRQELLAGIWGEEWLGDSRTLEVHIRWLRLKVEDDPTNPKYIQTVRGYGYRFISQEELG